MAFLAIYLVVFTALIGYSSSTYCLCNSALNATVLQKNIDYACGAGADCTPILPNGPCFNPNTVTDHCNYAVNSYFQRKAEVTGSCDFTGTALQSQTPPSGQSSTCVYASSSSSLAPPTASSTNGTTPAGLTPSFTPGTSTLSPPFGFAPSSGINHRHHNRHREPVTLLRQSSNFFRWVVLYLGLVWLRV